MPIRRELFKVTLVVSKKKLTLIEVHTELRMCSCRHHGDDIGLDLEVVHERRLIECHGMHKTPAMASCTTKHLPRPVPPHIIHSFPVSLSLS